MMKRSTAIIGFLCGAAHSLAQELPRFDIEKDCKALPLERARACCVREERYNEKLLSHGWTEITAGLSRDAGATCVTPAKAAPAFRYWTLYNCLGPAPELARAACK